MVEEESLSATAFRQTEKKYQLHQKPKLRLSKGRLRGKGWVERETDFSEVIDVRRGLDEESIQRNGIRLISAPAAPKNQRIYSFDNHPGFFLLPGALTQEEQFQLMEAAWLDFPNPPAKTNLFNQYGDVPNLFAAASSDLHLRMQPEEETSTSAAHPPPSSTAELCEAGDMLKTTFENSESCGERIPDSCDENCASDSMGKKETLLSKQNQGDTHCWVKRSGGPSAKSLLQKLRWATLGPHFDWTEREYIISKPYKQLPQQLESIGVGLAGMVGISFKPDAALVNYYYKGSTIGGHKDDAEQDMSQPIVSLSLGCPAVFLMGGETRDVPPTPLFLHSGDAVILSGKARGCFHGVPRVLAGSNHQQSGVGGCGWTNKDPPEEFFQYLERMRNTRINISVRRVLA